jgi:branched-chain amino acid transport system permease protein
LAIESDKLENPPKNKDIITLVALLLIVIIAVMFSPDYIVYMAALSASFAIAASGWNISYGYSGLLSFGHIAFFGLSAYFVIWFVLFFDMTPWIGIPISAAIISLLGYAVARVTRRLVGIYFALATAVMPRIISILFTWPDVWDITHGSYGMSFPLKRGIMYMDFDNVRIYLILSLTVLVLVLMGMVKLNRSILGYYLKAIGQDEMAAKTIGINPFKTRSWGFMISAFVTALGGGMYIILLKFIDPYSAFGWEHNLLVVLPSILGGVGTIVGPVFGSFILIPLLEFSKKFLGEVFPGFHVIVYGIVLMILIRFMPGGIYPELKKKIMGR